MLYSVYKREIRNDAKQLDERRGQSDNPAGRRRGARNKATLAAAILLEDEALGLMRRAVEAALAGDMSAMKLCLERVLSWCHERPSAPLCRGSRPSAMAKSTNRRRRTCRER
jgi:hypothetical protein